MEFLKSNPVDPIDRSALEAFCGVGVVITLEQITEKVKLSSLATDFFPLLF